MSLIAFSVRRTSVVNPRYLWAALKVTREKRVRMTVGAIIFRGIIGTDTGIKTLDDVPRCFRELLGQPSKGFGGNDSKSGVLCSTSNGSVVNLSWHSYHP